MASSCCCSGRAAAARRRCCQRSRRSCKPERGSIRVGDTEVTELHGAALAEYRRRTVGVVFQAFNLVPSLTTLDNVAVAAWNVGMSGRAGRARARAVLESLDLGDRLHHRPGRPLGRSAAARRDRARACASTLRCCSPTSRPPISTSSRSRACSASCATRRSPGRAVVVATHDDRLLPLADRVVELTPRRHPVHARSRTHLARSR